MAEYTEWNNLRNEKRAVWARRLHGDEGHEA